MTLLNIHKPRDRSHYERFAAYHETFYRSVEATSVTPFSPRALDRGLAGTLVALARQGHAADDAAPGRRRDPAGAGHAWTSWSSALAERAQSHAKMRRRRKPSELRQTRPGAGARPAGRVEQDRAWNYSAGRRRACSTRRRRAAAQRLLYEFLNPELKTLPPRHRKFRANRSMRDVEPSVNLWLKTLDGIDVEEEDE